VVELTEPGNCSRKKVDSSSGTVIFCGQITILAVLIVKTRNNENKNDI
jgi:hypothetical protein